MVVKIVSIMRITVIFSLALIIIRCGSDLGKDYHLDEDTFDAESLKMVEQRTGIMLPTGSRGIHMFYQGSQIDPSFVAKVEIPMSAHEAVAKQIEKLNNETGSVSGSLTEKVTWWNLSKSTIEVERQFTLDGNYVHVLFCKENDMGILYLEWIKI